ncbi:MAG: hypothetical protein JW995_02405 [Melioribacteraceae bacterium]|nr:hypothetical protein [Melioribacteraceae bacterium]
MMNEETGKEIEDYLKEFETSINFDSEDCPKCDLDNKKQNIKIAAWVELISGINEDERKLVGEKLSAGKIHFFFKNPEKGFFNLYVLNDDIDSVKKILNMAF